MTALSDPSALLSERYRSERTALERERRLPGRRLAPVRYWLGRVRLEIVFSWLSSAPIWFVTRRDRGVPG